MREFISELVCSMNTRFDEYLMDDGLSTDDKIKGVSSVFDDVYGYIKESDDDARSAVKQSLKDNADLYETWSNDFHASIQSFDLTTEYVALSDLFNRFANML